MNGHSKNRSIAAIYGRDCSGKQLLGIFSLMQRLLLLWRTVLYVALVFTAFLALFLLVFAWTPKSGLLVIPLLVAHALAIFGTRKAINSGKAGYFFVLSQIPFVVGGGWLFYTTNQCGHC